jgi:hypothetical protein
MFRAKSQKVLKKAYRLIFRVNVGYLLSAIFQILMRVVQFAFAF